MRSATSSRSVDDRGLPVTDLPVTVLPAIESSGFARVSGYRNGLPE